MTPDEVSKNSFSRFAAARRQPVRLSASDIVVIEPLDAAAAIPIAVRPNMEGVDLAEWIGSRRDDLHRRLHEHGALLFRGFGIRTAEEFARVGRAFAVNLMDYGERSSPRSRVAERVFTSTDHPPELPIVLHNEQSYTLNWPMTIMFCCVQPAVEGGRTPIADTRRVLARLPADVIGAFEAKGIKYVRNYGQGLGLGWRETFQTESRSEVERHCAAAGIGWEWRSDDRLRTWQVRPAVRAHPVTGARIWFNHGLFFHFTSLDPAAQQAILDTVGADEVPFNTYYGDGTPIEPSTLETLRAAYRDETIGFDWQMGDVLVLDNMLTAHGREAFRGPRRVLTIMAEPFAEAASV